jgi:fructose-6-phosphate aldolase 2
MIYFADTADLQELKKLYTFFPLDGVTTNPTILNNSGLKLSVAIEGIQNLVGNGMVHVQMLSPKADDMVREAKNTAAILILAIIFTQKYPLPSMAIMPCAC